MAFINHPLVQRTLQLLITLLLIGTVSFVGFKYVVIPQLSKILGGMVTMNTLGSVENKIYVEGKHTDIQLDSVVSYKISAYHDILQAYRKAGPDETITLHLTGMGGSTMVQSLLSAAIANSKADTVVSVDGTIISAHVYIMLSAKKVRVTNTNGSALMHRAAIGGSEIRMCKDPEFLEKKNSEFTCKNEELNIRQLMKDIYTEAEIQQVLDGDDLLITLGDLKQRLQKAGRLVE